MQQFLYKRLRALVFTSLLAQSVSTIVFAEEASAIILTSRVLKFIDGIPHAMDGHTILDMKIISHKMRAVIFGHLDPQTNKRVGTFDFQDKKVSLHTLARIEDRIEVNYKTAREELEHKYVDMTLFNKKWQMRERALIEIFDTQIEKIEEEMMVRHKSDDVREIAIKQAKRNIMRKHEQLVQGELKRIKQEHMQDLAKFTTELTDLETKRAHQLQLWLQHLPKGKKHSLILRSPLWSKLPDQKILWYL